MLNMPWLKLIFHGFSIARPLVLTRVAGADKRLWQGWRLFIGENGAGAGIGIDKRDFGCGKGKSIVRFRQDLSGYAEKCILGIGARIFCGGGQQAEFDAQINVGKDSFPVLENRGG